MTDTTRGWRPPSLGRASLLLAAGLLLAGPAGALDREEEAAAEAIIGSWGELPEGVGPWIWVDEPQALSVVISGGVSRGDYQAGQLYALVEYLERAKESGLMGSALHPSELVLTGASAGGINALLASVTLLRGSDRLDVDGAPTVHPEDSLFFKAWIPFGLTYAEDSLDFHPWAHQTDRGGELWDLMSAAAREEVRLDELPGGMPPGLAEGALPAPSIERHEGSLLSHESFRAFLRVLQMDFGGEALSGGAFEELRLGMTTTRLSADSDELGVTREVTESFAFLLTQGASVRPLTRACPSITAGQPPPLSCDFSKQLLVDGGARRVGFDDGRLAVTVSQWSEGGVYGDAPQDSAVSLFDAGWFIMPTSGIPIAFPLKQTSCEAYLGAAFLPPRHCHANPQFANAPLVWIDGGAYDGTPVRLARGLARPLVRWDGARFEAPGEGEVRELEVDVERQGFDYILIDPDFKGHPPAPVGLPGRPSPPFAEALGDALLTTRLQSLTQYFLDNGGDYERARIFTTDTTPVSDYFGDFFGLFDRSFRVWDFYAGLYDTRAQLSAWILDPKVQAALSKELSGARGPGRAVTPDELLGPTPESGLYQAIAGVLDVVHDDSEGGVRARWREPVAMSFPEHWSRCAALSAELDALVDDAFAGLEGDASLQRAATAELIPTAHRYPADALLLNLRTVTRHSVDRLLGEALPVEIPEGTRRCADVEAWDEQWFVHALSELRSCEREGEGCLPFAFQAIDLGEEWAAADKPPRRGTDFGGLLRRRISWLTGQAIAREMLPGSDGVALYWHLARNASFAPHVQLSLLSSSPLFERALTTVGAGLDIYPPQALPLSLGARVLGSVADDTIGGVAVADAGSGNISGVWAFDLRAGVNPVPLFFPNSMKLVGPLRSSDVGPGGVTFELGWFARAAWAGGYSGLTQGGAVRDPVDSLIGTHYQLSERWAWTHGPELRAVILGLVEVDLWWINPFEPQLGFAPLRATVGLRLPGPHRYRPSVLSGWSESMRHPIPGSAVTARLRAPELLYGAGHLSVDYDLRDALGVGVFGHWEAERRLMLSYPEGQRLDYRLLGGEARLYFGRRPLTGERYGGHRSWVFAPGVGFAAADAVDAQGLSFTGRGLGGHLTLGHQWRPQSVERPWVRPTVIVGGGVRGAYFIQTDGDASALDLRYQPWQLAPDLVIELGWRTR